MSIRKLWHTLSPGMVFRFDDKLYLKTHGKNILSLDDFSPVGLHDDVQVEPVGKLSSLAGKISYREYQPTLEELLEECNRIVNSDMDWEKKYDAIFSDRISRRVFDELWLYYSDPDTDYEEDVMAFVNAFRERMKERA